MNLPRLLSDLVKRPFHKARNVFVVGGRRYRLPNEISYRQYAYASSVMEEAGVRISLPEDASAEGFAASVGVTLSAALRNDLAPRLLAALLVPVGETRWREEHARNAEAMRDVGDRTLGEIVTLFFSERSDLLRLSLRLASGSIAPSGISSPNTTDAANATSESVRPSDLNSPTTGSPSRTTSPTTTRAASTPSPTPHPRSSSAPTRGSASNDSTNQSRTSTP